MNEFDIGSIVFGNWKIVRQIGQGSFGTVFQIERHQTYPNAINQVQRAALKVLYIPKNYQEVSQLRGMGMDNASIQKHFQTALERLCREIDMMYPLKGHGNIVGYEDHQIIQRNNGEGWIILIRMELLTPINIYIEKHPMTLEQCLHMGIDLCQALEACEQYNIIHRDIKPDNIFVNSFGSFKLGDFGIARTAEGTTTGTMTGTYHYMAPEVFNGQKYNATVDIYSLGIVLYQYLNKGRLPFVPVDSKYVSLEEIAKASSYRFYGNEIPPILCIDPALSDIIVKACSFQSKDRYQSAKEFKEALLHYQKSLEYRNYPPAAPPVEQNPPVRQNPPADHKKYDWHDPSVTNTSSSTIRTLPADESAYTAPANPVPAYKNSGKKNAEPLKVITDSPTPPRDDHKKKKTPILLIAAGIGLLCIGSIAAGMYVGKSTKQDPGITASGSSSDSDTKDEASSAENDSDEAFGTSSDSNTGDEEPVTVESAGSDTSGSPSTGYTYFPNEYSVDELKLMIWDSNQQAGLQQICDEWTELSGVRVSIEVADWDNYWTLLEAGAVGETMPDVFWMHSNVAQMYMAYDILLDLTPYVEESGLDTSAYYDGILNLYTREDGNIYALPKDHDTIALLYNKAIFDEYGVDVPTADDSWETIIEKAAAITEASGGEVYGYAMNTSNNQDGWYNIVYDYGGQIITDDHLGTTIGSDEGKAGMEIVRQLLEAGGCPQTVVAETGTESLFKSGKVAMITQGSWMINSYYTADNAADYFWVEMPYGDANGNGTCDEGERWSAYNGLGWAAAATVADPQACYDLIAYLCSDEAQKEQAALGVTMGGMMGISEDFANAFPGMDVSAFMTIEEDGSLFFRPYTKNTTVWEDALQQTGAFLDAWQDPSNPETMSTACDNAQQKIDDCIASEY